MRCQVTREIEIYRPHERLPTERSGPDPRLPHPTPALPADFPITGIFQLLRLHQAARLSGRYAAALDALAGAYHAAAGVHEAKLDLSRSIERLRDKDTILAADKRARDAELVAREDELFRAEARRALGELEMYRAKAALAEFKSGGTSGTTAANAFASDAEKIIKGILGENT